MKKSIFAMFVLILSLTFALPLYAECQGGHCPMKKAGKGASYHGGREKYHCPIVAKFMKKADFYLENQKDLGLSEEQIKTIKDLHMDAKKAYLRQSAEAKIFELDLHSKMSEPKVDVEGINAMIDSGMAAMNTSAKATIAAYAKLKSVLSDDQTAKAKELHASKKHHA